MHDLIDAPGGLAFAPGAAATATAGLGPRFASGAFVGEHGSWNRKTTVGYRVVFIPFRGGQPAGNPVEFVSGFLKDGKARGRPVGVTLDPRGALIVAGAVLAKIAVLVSASTQQTA